jgi:tripartite-type tricarboxylate transporter receptor subunit TctC
MPERASQKKANGRSSDAVASGLSDSCRVVSLDRREHCDSAWTNASVVRCGLREKMARALLGVLLSCLVSSAAWCQSWPARPVRIVVPYTPGGGIDTVARTLAIRLGEQLGASFVVDNRPGAAGVVGAELVARAPADGHTLLASATEFATNPAVRGKLPYDPLRDFAPISQLASVQFILASHPSVPVRSVRDLIALAKARPGRLTYGSSGTGGGPHLAGELLQSMTHIRWVHVPYKGAAPAGTAAISGDIDFVFGATIGLLGQVRYRNRLVWLLCACRRSG